LNPVAVDLDQKTPALSGSSARAQAPVVIEATGIEKTFHIPENKVESLKERFLSFSGSGHRDLHALRAISFEIHQGEFFGIVGRNGSGKSTLLKILASIYQADAGRLRMAGRLAPFIELGVGFNQELTARENVELNGVMMGLPRREARRRLGAVLDFAELGEFVDLKLKNYSSGMLVRLAFSVMIQSDADILLIDEVLAVGDASFQQKCADVFHEIRDSGRTVVFVTHDMPAVEHYCHRAILLHDGEISAEGDPGEVAREYLRLNFETAGALTPDAAASEAAQVSEEERADLSVADAWLEGSNGERIANLETGAPATLCTTLEARRDIERPAFAFTINNADDVHVTGFGVKLDPSVPDRIAAGERVEIRCMLENRLAPDRYVVKCWIHRNDSADIALHSPHVLDFVVFGHPAAGIVSLDHDVSVKVDRG
jgi:ABC-type polysaccharide/polyol phosphate transport system ATPase subunit